MQAHVFALEIALIEAVDDFYLVELCANRIPAFGCCVGFVGCDIIQGIGQFVLLLSKW
ncbi:hypothetical protein D3C80_2099800 [compost metagenome]